MDILFQYLILAFILIERLILCFIEYIHEEIKKIQHQRDKVLEELLLKQKVIAIKFLFLTMGLYCIAALLVRLYSDVYNAF